MRDKEKHRTRQQEWYRRNRETAIARAKEARERNRRWLAELKAKPCQDCGIEWPPFCMDFHHRDKTEKVERISWLINNAGRQRVLAEIEKCDLVCSNCHKIREYGQSDTST